MDKKFTLKKKFAAEASLKARRDDVLYRISVKEHDLMVEMQNAVSLMKGSIREMEEAMNECGEGDYYSTESRARRFMQAFENFQRNPFMREVADEMAHLHRAKAKLDMFDSLFDETEA